VPPAHSRSPILIAAIIAADSPSPCRSYLLSGTPPRPSSKKVPTSSSSGSKVSGGGGGGEPKSKSSPSPPRPGTTFPTFEELISGPEHLVATHIYALPLFHHTCRAARPSRSDTSRPCEGVLKSGGWKVFDLFRAGFFSFELARYVRVCMMGPTIEQFDFLIGSREAFLLHVDLFNTFHLESSRTQLHTLVRPAVFAALENSWKMLDAVGLRLQWKVRISDTLVRGYHFHDIDVIGDDSGGGGGIAVPIAPDVPPAATGGGRGPGDAATDKISSGSSSSSGSGGAQATKRKGRAQEPVRYVDLDMQYHVAESFELFTTRPDQVPPTEKEDQTSDSIARAAAEIKKMMSATKADAPKDAPKSTDSKQHPPTDPISSPSVDHAALLNEMNERVAETAAFQTDSIPLRSEPILDETSAQVNNTSASASTDTSASTATPSASSSSTSTSRAPAADFLPPLKLFFGVSDITERGLRFWTSLPESVPFGEQPYWSSTSPKFAAFSHDRIDKAPTANWIIKDIID
jgi:hypothetical protein